jgi:hypothetical protein
MIVTFIPTLVANICGFMGMGSVVSAYLYSTIRQQPNLFIHHSLNLTGAILLLISLLVFTNYASIVLELVWASIAIIGLIKTYQDIES